MNIIKNFFKGLISKEKLGDAWLATKDWVFSLTFMKITALIVVNCFLLTAVYGEAVAGLLENNRATEQFKQVFDDFDLPYSYGKITSADYKASDTVVINIQDLHSHAEVQRNINNIISLFDEKYGVKNVYLEGAYGQVSTKWLTVAKDENVRNSVMNKLLESGRLTGAEYFSASKGKTEIIKGLENKDAYFDNLKRFGALIDNQNTIVLHFDSIKDTVKQLQEQYYNRQQKKIEELSAGYVAGTIEANKYFALMRKHAEKLAVDIESYPNLAMYITLLDKQKEINYQRTTQELQLFVVKLKENLPYNAYKMLLNETKNFSQMDKLYGYMIKLSRQYNLDLSQNFKELEKFFAYIELSQAINPLELIKEEQNFKDEINDRFSENKAEEEVVFLSNFVRYYQDYLTGKITTDDCNYYKQNIEKFKYLWVKYIDNKEIAALQDYENMSDTFYKINFERNNYFMENMREVLDGQKMTEAATGNDELQKAMNSLQQAKEVYITVTGGFHTQEMSAMLSRAGITNIVITPNVTGDTKIAEETYYKIAQEQAKISFQALATLALSEAPMQERLKAIMDIQSVIKDIGAANAKEYIKAIVQDGELGKVADVNLEVKNDSELESVTISFVDQPSRTINKSGEVTTDKGMNKSIKSIGQTLAAAFGLATFFTGATVAAFVAAPLFLLFGYNPIVPMLSRMQYYAGATRLLGKELAFMLSANKVSESDATSRETMRDLLAREFPDLLDEEIIVITDGLESGEFGEVDSNGLVHLNYSLMNRLFIRNGNIVNRDMLEVFLRHELRHVKRGNKTGLFEEIRVGLGDFGDYVALKARAALTERMGNYSVEAVQKALAAKGIVVPAGFDLFDFVIRQTVDSNLTPEEWADRVADAVQAEIEKEIARKAETLKGKTVELVSTNNKEFTRFIGDAMEFDFENGQVILKRNDGSTITTSNVRALDIKDGRVTVTTENHVYILDVKMTAFEELEKEPTRSDKDKGEKVAVAVEEKKAEQKQSRVRFAGIDPALEEAFRDANAERFGEGARNNDQTNIQIKVAGLIALFKNVHLGTGGGKTAAGQLALAQILINQARGAYGDGKFTIDTTCGLYMTKDSQLVSDMKGFYSFLSRPAIKKMLVEAGYIKEGQDIVLGYVIKNSEGKDEYHTISKDGDQIFTGDFAQLQQICAVVGYNLSSFSHLYQNGKFNPTQNIFTMHDEGHVGLVDTADSPNSIASQEEVQDAQAKQSALTIIMSLAIEMYEETERKNQENPDRDTRRDPYSLQNGTFQLNDDSFGSFGRDDAYKSYYERAKQAYPGLTVQEWKKYLNAALGTISEFRGHNGYAFDKTAGTVSLLTNDKQLAIGQKRQDWGQLFLEL